MENPNYYEMEAISYLPDAVQSAVRKTTALFQGRISEIRVRTGKSIFVKAGKKNIKCGAVCTYEMMKEIIKNLTDSSMYCHTDTVNEGYISTFSGIRAGVCGRAVVNNGKIINISDIDSICIRIPHRIRGICDNLCRAIMKPDFRGMVIYAPPCGGKTTALREICARLSDNPYNISLVVVDTRYEITPPIKGDFTFDSLLGYPRDKGMEIALRTLSPQLILCDEIGSEAEAEAVLQGVNSGVPFVVTAHASSYCELSRRPFFKRLSEADAFSTVVGIEYSNGEYSYRFADENAMVC